MKSVKLFRNDTVATTDTPQGTVATTTMPEITLITGLAGLLSLEKAWRKLEANCSGHTSVFQSFDWIATWCEVYAGKAAKVELHVLTGYDGDELVFVWPLMKQSRLGIKVLSWLTEPFGQYGDVLCAKGHCPKRWIEASFGFLRRLKGIDILRLRHVREDSHLAKSSLQFFSDAKSNERAPFLDLTQFATEQDYELRYTPTQRKRRKKIRKHLEDIGPVTFTRLPAGTLADAAIENAIAEKNQWLNDRARYNRVVHCPGHTDFLKKLSRRFGGTTEVIVSELKAGDQPVSWEIGFRHGKTHFAYLTSHMNAHTDLSPGRLHMDLSQRASLEAGMQRFDLMVPYDPHKESWSSGCAATKDYFAPLSASGWLAGHVYLGTIRPVVQKLYYTLQPTVLRWLRTRSNIKVSVMMSWFS